MNMPLQINPFHQIYVSDSVNPEVFGKIFSPLLLSDTLALFQPGNVILEGVQGSGKSMLLSLLKPEIRIAYMNSDTPFPVPELFSDFVSGGINLIRSSVLDFGQRSIELGNEGDIERIPLYFADFVNCWIVLDIFASIELLSSINQKLLSPGMRFNSDKESLDRFAKLLIKEDCWSGYLNSSASYEEVKKALQSRIRAYRNFFGFRTDNIPAEISSTITEPGEPISHTAKILWKAGVVPESTPFYIRIDQCEEITRLEAKSREKRLHQEFRSVINKIIGTRDPNISYRLGGRKYAFRTNSDARMLGSTGPIEDFRNFKIVDLDEILRRRENRRTWIFPKFAEDVFRKRLEVSGYSLPASTKDFLIAVFGGSHLTVAEKVKMYVGKNNPKSLIAIDESFPAEIVELINKIAETDLLSAKLGEAWIRQQIIKQKPDIPHNDYLPWESTAKKWWKKERMVMASLQIAAKRSQKMIWARKDDILDLAGGNVLMFLSICQHIWAAWLRSLPRDTNWSDNKMPLIHDPYIQSEGIEEASDRWYDKITEEPDGHARRRFISYLGNEFRNQLRSDLKMSYPGHNGISVALADLESDVEVYNILKDASAYGFMVDRKHTSKTKTRGECRKWYLHPILSPHFQIPVSHTKEPIYANTKLLRKWLEKAQVL